MKIERQTKEKLDHLVKKKIFRNKSEAVRKMLDEHLAEHPELFLEEELEELLRGAARISDEEFRARLAVGLKSPKSVAEMLGDERDRLA